MLLPNRVLYGVTCNTILPLKAFQSISVYYKLVCWIKSNTHFLPPFTCTFCSVSEVPH